MKKMFIVIDNNMEDKMETIYKYDEGEIITVNSNTPAKCVKIETINGETIYHFKTGKISYEF